MSHQKRRGHGAKGKQSQEPTPPTSPSVTSSSSSRGLATASNFSQLNWYEKTASDAVKTEDSLSLEESSEVSDPLFSEDDTQMDDDVDVSQSKYFQDNPDLISRLYERGFLPEHFTEVDQELPEGFRFKANRIKEGREVKVKKTFLTPGGIVLQSSLGVLEYMRLLDNSAKEIRTVAEHLLVTPKVFESWIERYVP